MNRSLLTVLFLLLTTSAGFAQTRQNSPVISAPTGTNPPSVSTTKKRVDLNNLIRLSGQKAPDFITADMNGTEYKLENLRGKIVVINLWATWCEPCIKEMPELNNLIKKYKDKDVVFLAAAPEEKAVLEGFLQKNPFAYQILPGASDIIEKYSPKEKPDPVTGKSRTIRAMPTHIVIDRDGTVIKHSWGFSIYTLSQLTETIEQLLAQK